MTSLTPYRTKIITVLRHTPSMEASRMIRRMRRHIEQATGAECISLYDYLEHGQAEVLSEICRKISALEFSDAANDWPPGKTRGVEPSVIFVDEPLSDIPSDSKTHE